MGELKVHGIDCRVALPGVGRGLQDHLRLSFSAATPLRQRVQMECPAVGITGNFRSPERTQDAWPRAPDLQFILWFSQDDEGNPEAPAMSRAGGCVVLLHPRARGSVCLSSADPHDDPKIDPKYFAG